MPRRLPIARTAAALAAPLLVIAGLAGCAPAERPLVAELRAEAAEPLVLDAADASAASIAASERRYAASGLAVVASEPLVAGLVDDAVAAGAPLLVAGPGLADELGRLGVEVVVHADGDAPEGVPDGIRMHPVDPDADPAATGAPALERAGEGAAADAGPGAGGALLVDPDSPEALGAGALAAGATVEAAGGAVVELPGGDPRATSATIAAVRAHADGPVLAIGESFGTSERFAARLEVVADAPELPGGGQLVLHEKLLVAHYGHPGEPVLGVLGEHDVDTAIELVKARADEYRERTGLTVVPTFEIITTIASGGPGPDGDYSSESSIEHLRPWVDRAGEEGVYVVLDLQPGRTSFLDQAQRYEELLVEPHVGLALDPEWRLGPDQRHMVHIGSVHADEVNATMHWLADLAAEHGLPQKLLVVHQFMPRMVTERERLDASRDEVVVLVHVDGHGSPGDKRATWERLLEELPDGVELGWKNFIDEDLPMFTVDETLAIEPLPSFVSYQ
ncbi:MAG: hypothetical protein GXX90_10820 [Microbacteriaceae bacterium]|nr:hypothetical protein [Microbacteriaceae bacterium]